MTDKLLIALGISIMTLMFVAGVLGSSLYYDYFNPKEVCNTRARINGLWLQDMSKLKEYPGNYICINIEETKTLTDLVNVCQHEAGHEVFARYCEKDISKCLEVEK